MVTEARRKLRLTYTEEALATYDPGTPLLSLSLPLTTESFPNGVVRAFLDGLLPEGEARRVIAQDFGVRADDTMGLAMAVGRDCAGALVIQPEGDAPPPRPTIQTAERLTDTDLAELVSNLRSAPLGVNPRVRISLAGVQEKLLLTRLGDGAWGRPVDGTPSTHILKPQMERFPNTVENEAFCMRAARKLGLPVAEVTTTAVAGQLLLVVTRYDRIIEQDGAVQRIHQEDFCQALGVPPNHKYQEDGGPSLRSIAEVLRVNDPGALDTLARATTLNVALGNGDAHGKNFSLLHDVSGRLRLAPAYDLLSTRFYGDDRLAMHVDHVRRIDRVTTDRIVNEAMAWGMSKTRAATAIESVVEALPAALNDAEREAPFPPAGLRELIDDQLAVLLGDNHSRTSRVSRGRTP